MKYVIGLDVGIGSVGWAVIRNEEIKRIEDFGVRIFPSGESPKDNSRLSQKRRTYRSTRRLTTRRSHRKWRLKAHLQNIGFVKTDEIKKYFEEASPNIIALRVKALDEKISPAELSACLINICNRRGYNEFYGDDSDSTAKKQKEFEESKKKTLEIMNFGYRTVAEMILKDDHYKIEGSEFRCYRNNGLTDRKNLFTRDMLKSEVRQILNEQKKYYPQLDDNNIDIIFDIIFSQRDFEDGPGDANDKYRAYKGFLDSIGNCSFYKDEKRGSRFTLLADVYSAINVLSQFIYVDEKTGEFGLTADIADELVSFILRKGNITLTNVKKICKSHGKTIKTVSSSELSRCLKFTKTLKPVFEEAGYNWAELSQDYASLDGILNKTGIFLSENITPKRRRERAEKELSFLSKELVENLISKKPSGTSNVSYKFMIDSINAFLRGESYGSFQAAVNAEKESIVDESQKQYLLPPFKSDHEFYKNPVVFRSINETRKIINAIIRKYGSPFAINIEVGSELNKSLEDRQKDDNNRKKNEKANDEARAAVAEIIGKTPKDVTPAQLERYKLGEEQDWVCLYSGKKIEGDEKAEAILDKNHKYEVDHIVPFSWILDDTLNNKALVKHEENQTKGQNIPLKYLTGEKADSFIGRVNLMLKNKKIKERKYKYLMLKTVDSKLLSEWKSRNLNDTRYISKFLVNYLDNNLKFNTEGKEKYERGGVYAVKSAITSRLRRQWLNSGTWGTKNKDELKAITYLDHAADAIVIANCMPAYVEMAALNQKLKDIFYSSHKIKTEEYKNTLEEAMDNLLKFYGVPKSVSELYLEYRENTTSLVPNLRQEADIRLCDFETDRYFSEKAAKEKGYDYEKESNEAIEGRFRKAVRSYYSYDTEFAESIQMPITSQKQDKKVNKGLFDEKPISIKNIDGTDYQIVSKSILEITKKELPNIYTNDTKLIKELEALMQPYGDKTKIGEALKAKGLTEFIYNSRPVRKLKLKNSAPKSYFIKEISDTNRTILDNRNYYCVEIYKASKTSKNSKASKEYTGVCAIAYSDLVVSDGKLYLRADYKYPDDYVKHEMYLFPMDYVRITDGRKEFEGYYKSVKDIGAKELNTLKPNGNKNKDKEKGKEKGKGKDYFSITQKANITKYYIDILGKKGGEIKCGEPLSLITEKK